MKERLLLLLRATIIFFLVMAFARPYFTERNNRIQNLPTKISILYIDNSFSMALMTPQGSLLDIAKKKCLDLANQSSPDTRFLLMTNDYTVNEDKPIYSHELILRINRVSISLFHRRIDDLVNRAQQICQNDNLTPSGYYFFSDFQYNTISENKNERENIRKNSAKIVLNPIRSSVRNDLSLDSVWFTSPVFRPGYKTEAVLRIKKSQSSLTIPGITMKLNGQLTALQNPKAVHSLSVNDTFQFIPKESGIQNLQFSMADNMLAFNNMLFATINVRKMEGILLISGLKPNKFLKAVFEGDPYIKLSENSEDHIDYSLLSEQSCVILDRLQKLSSGLALELSKFMKEGGTVLYIPDIENTLEKQKSFLESLKLDYPVGFSLVKSRVLHLDVNQDLFKGVFESMPRNAQLPEALHYLRLSNNHSEHAVLKLASGDNLLGWQGLGKGRWFNMAAPFEDSCQNTQRQSLFVPLIYQVALSSSIRDKIYYFINQDKTIPGINTRAMIGQSKLNTALKSEGSEIRLKGHGIEIIPDFRAENNFYIGDELKTPGFFSLSEGGKVLKGYAFNYERSESNLEYYTDNDLQRLTGISPLTYFNTEHFSSLTNPSRLGAGSSLWKVCLILALIFLALEEIILHKKEVKKKFA